MCECGEQRWRMLLEVKQWLSEGLVRIVNSSVIPKESSCCRPLVNGPIALLFH